MHERRYTATIERLRLPQRVELLEIDRVVDLVLSAREAEFLPRHLPRKE